MAKHSALTRGKKDKALKALNQNRLPEAIQLLTQVCRMDPGDATAWRLLASAHGRAGNFAAAADCAGRAAGLRPGDATAHSILGNALAGLGRHREAFAAYREALRLQPDDPGVLNNLGTALYLAGDLPAAAETLEQLLRLRPDYADAHNNLGNICKALDRVDEAIRHFQQALSLKPDLFEAHLNLGTIFSDRVGHPVAAEEHFREALRLRPGHPEALAGLANMLRFQGRYEEALAILQAILRQQPQNVGALALEADILERQGAFDRAYEHARTLIDSGNARSAPLSVDVLLRLCRRHGCCAEAIELAEQLAEDGALRDTDRQLLHFSLGRLLDRQERFDEAFRHYRCANELNQPPFDPDAYGRYVDELIATYRPAALARLPRGQNADRRPVFIVGMPRSGTSLTEQILVSHPEVHGAGELNDINDLVAGLPAAQSDPRPYPQCLEALTQEVVDRLARRHLDKLTALSDGARYVTDKMPHNFMNLGLIALLFPGARIIHCVRDARDTCLSIYFQNFGWLHPYGSDLTRLGRYYRDYQRLMAHWESTLDLPMLTMHYEALVADQEGVTRALLDFCNLEWDDRCLRFHESERGVATASYDQVRQAMYTRSRERWRNYEPHITPLIHALDGGSGSPPPPRTGHDNA